MSNPPVPDPAVEPVVSVERAGDCLGISRSTAYASVHDGTIPSIRLGRRLVVPTAALRRLLELDA
jgi:excisionase family DNA binding protein